MELNLISYGGFEHIREFWLGYRVACWFIFDFPEGYETVFYSLTRHQSWSSITRVQRLQTWSASIEGTGRGKCLCFPAPHPHASKQNTFTNISRDSITELILSSRWFLVNPVPETGSMSGKSNSYCQGVNQIVIITYYWFNLRPAKHCKHFRVIHK